jgi:hypothetical protein
VEIFGGGDLPTVEKKELGKKCFCGFICGAAFHYGRHVQLQTGCDRLFSVKTASDLPPPPNVIPRFKQKYW